MAGSLSHSAIPMAKTARRKRHPFDDAVLSAKGEKPVPHEFVLDGIASLSPVTRPMFGCMAVYVDDKIVLILRDKRQSPADNGVWMATTVEHHESLRKEFPRMHSIRVLGKEPTGWQVLRADDPDFEAAALRLCQLVLARDSRIGKVPKSRTSRARLPSGRSRQSSKRARAIR